MKQSIILRPLSIGFVIIAFYAVSLLFGGSMQHYSAIASLRSPQLAVHKVTALNSHDNQATTTPTITNNWAGYGILPAVQTQSFKVAAGTWIQPAMTCNSKTDTEYAPQWVGLDGFSSATVEQAGVTAACKKGVKSYQAFTEAYPKAAIYLSTTTYHVNPGDTMSASDSYAGVNGSLTDFTLVINDVTAGWTRTVNASLPTTDGPFGTSAEWITEDLGNTIPDFGSVNFTNATAKDNSGVSGGIGAFNYQTTYITDSNGLNVVSPSALGADQSSFTNTWNAAQ